MPNQVIQWKEINMGHQTQVLQDLNRETGNKGKSEISNSSGACPMHTRIGETREEARSTRKEQESYRRHNLILDPL